MSEESVQTQTDNLAQVAIGGEAQATVQPQTVTEPAWYTSAIKDPILQSDPSVTKFKSAEDMAKSYINLQRAFGANKVAVPTEKSSKEEWDAYFEKAGMPKDAQGYELADTEEGALISKKDFAEFARQNRFTNAQAKGLQEWFVGQMTAKQKAHIEAIEAKKGETEAVLRKELGEKYDATLMSAKKALDIFTDAQDRDSLIEEFGNDTRFIKMLAKISSHVSEGSLGDLGRIKSVLTPMEAEAEYMDIVKNKADPAHNPAHPAYKERQAHMQRLAQSMLSGR